MMRKYLLILFCACMLAGCSEYRVSEDPTLRLSFSCDTLSFDSVFTEQGSATMQLMVYNRNASAMMIDRVWMEDGEAFAVNIDGETDLNRLNALQINGGDSMFVFVRVTDFGRMEEDGAIRIEDLLHFHLTNGTTQQVLIEAFALNATRLGRIGKGRTFLKDYTFTSAQPYILYDTVVVDGFMKMEAGAQLYMHAGACLYAQGDVEAEGTKEAPVLIRGDRLDRLFDSVPYLYAGGGWNGVYLVSETPKNYVFRYVDILSGNVGLNCTSTCTDDLPKLRMDGCRIHNHTSYGLVLNHIDALVTNTEISNCAYYCVYCDGGTHEFVHSTIASYFGYTNIRIQSAKKEETAAVYIDNLTKTPPQTVTSFYNSVITGYLPNQIVVATPFDRYYPGSFVGNYLKTDTLAFPHAERNTYWQKTDTAKVFVNDFYKYKEYVYYDFRLDSLSPAIGIGDSLTAVPYPVDRNGVSRALIRPDAGCYQHLP